MSQLPIDKITLFFDRYPCLPESPGVGRVYKTKGHHGLTHYCVLVRPKLHTLEEITRFHPVVHLHYLELTFGIRPLPDNVLQSLIFYQRWGRKKQFVFRGKTGTTIYTQDLCNGRRPAMSIVIYSLSRKMKMGEIRLFRRKLSQLKLFTLHDLLGDYYSGRLFEIQQKLLGYLAILQPDKENLTKYLVQGPERMKGLTINFLLKVYTPTGLFFHLKSGGSIAFNGGKPIRLSRYQLAKCFKPYS